MAKKKATSRPPLPPAVLAKEERYEESPPIRRSSSSAAAAAALPPRPTFVKQEPIKEEPIEPIEEEEEPEEEEPIEEEEEEEPIEEEEEEEPMEEEEEEEPMEEEEEEPMEEEEVEEVEVKEEVEEEEEEPIEEEDTTEEVPVYIEELPMAAARVATEENSQELPMAEARAETENSRELQMTVARVETENGEPSNIQEKEKLVSTLLNVEESGNLVSPPPFLKSIDELQGLSAALTNFLSRYEEIEKHFSFIQNAISEKEGKEKEEEEEKKRDEQAITDKEEEKKREQKAIANKDEEETKREEKAIANKEEEKKKREEKAIAEEVEKKREEKAITEKEVEEKKREQKAVAEKEEEEKKREQNAVTEKEEEKKMEEKTIAEKGKEEEKKEQEPVTVAPKHQNIPQPYPSAALEAICQGMSSLGFRKYIQSNLHNFPNLLSEVPISLRRADDPSKLVFKSMGRFYLQHSKTCVKDMNLSAQRHAAILALEFFLLAECFKINPSIKSETEAAALAWMKRMSSETNLSNIEARDAKGLLFFVASFGIPSSFTLRELVALFLSSNLREIAGPLRHSPFLMEKLPDIIQEMVKNGMAILAVDAIYNFSVQEKLPPEDILKSGLDQSEISWTKSHAFPEALKRANEKHIADLKSALKCLHEWPVDPRKLGKWNSYVINAKIAKLEKENSDLEENAVLKRKADATTSSEHVKNQELKRPRPSTGVSQQMHSKVMPIPEHMAVGLADGRRFSDGRFMGPINGYSGVSPVTGAAGGHLRGQITSIVGGNSGHAAGPAGGLIVGNGTSLHTAPFSGNGGFHGDGFMRQTSNGTGSFMWHGDGAYHGNNLLGYNPTRPMVSMGRGTFATAQAMNPHFPGQPNTPLGFSSQQSGSDLYQFADKLS